MQYLKFHRLNQGFTQKAIAKELGVKQSTYCDYENGHKKPHPKVHKRLADVLQRPVEELTAKLYHVNPEDMRVARAERALVPA